MGHHALAYSPHNFDWRLVVSKETSIIQSCLIFRFEAWGRWFDTLLSNIEDIYDKSGMDHKK